MGLGFLFQWTVRGLCTLVDLHWNCGGIVNWVVLLELESRGRFGAIDIEDININLCGKNGNEVWCSYAKEFCVSSTYSESILVFTISKTKR